MTGTQLPVSEQSRGALWQALQSQLKPTDIEVDYDIDTSIEMLKAKIVRDLTKVQIGSPEIADAIEVDIERIELLTTRDDVIDYCINECQMGPEQFGYTPFTWHQHILEQNIIAHADDAIASGNRPDFCMPEELLVDPYDPDNWSLVAADLVLKAMQDEQFDDQRAFLAETFESILRTLLPSITKEQIALACAKGV